MTEQTMEQEFAEIKEAADKAAKIGSSKMTEKVSKLLTQAERAPEGSPERETFMEKVITLSQAYSIDLTLARAIQAKKEKVEEPEERKYKVGEFGFDRGNSKTAVKKNAHFVDLMIAICEANDLEVLIGGSNVYVYAHGMPSDHEVAERLYALLSAQMVSEADAALKRGDNKVKRLLPKTVREKIPEEERAWGEPVPGEYGHYYAEDYGHVGRQEENVDAMVFDRYVYYTVKAPPTHRIIEVKDDDGNPIMEEKEVSSVDGRVWRTNFYKGFVYDIKKRLREAKFAAMRDAGVDFTEENNVGALAIRDKKKTVKESWEAHNRTVLATNSRSKGYGGAEISRVDRTALGRGQEAAQRARLGDEKDLGTDD